MYINILQVPASTNQQTPSRTFSMAEGARRENANAKGIKRKLALDKGEWFSLHIFYVISIIKNLLAYNNSTL